MEVGLIQRRKIANMHVLALALFACACTKVEYQYIALGGEMVVELLAKTKISSVKHDVAFPARYKMSREKYTLIAEVDLESREPAVFFYVSEETQIQLNVIGKFAHSCYGQFLPKRFWATKNVDPDRIYFAWIRQSDVQCAKRAPLDESELVLTIVLSDFSGYTVGTEKIPFVIENNGFYLVSRDFLP